MATDHVSSKSVPPTAPIRAVPLPEQCVVFRCFALGENAGGPARELPSRAGQGDPSRRAIDQSRAQTCLNPADGLGDRRFGKLQLRCRPGKGAHFHDFGEDRQAFEIRQLGHESECGNYVFQ